MRFCSYNNMIENVNLSLVNYFQNIFIHFQLVKYVLLCNRMFENVVAALYNALL